MDTNRMQHIQKYFCCAACFGDLVEVEKNGEADIECRMCGCKVFVTKTTAEIKTQKALEKEKKIKYKTRVFKIDPFYNKELAEKTVDELIAELGF